MAPNNVGGLDRFEHDTRGQHGFATGAVSGTTMVGGPYREPGRRHHRHDVRDGGVTATGDYAGGLIGFNTGAVKKSYAKPGQTSVARTGSVD